ncbi:uncharacterized protein LOC127751163 isoform X2 [Frankliniella occidentalis]|uniref:Uncharacterized protein LOC127751163 isoform X2 n=1 Tax=Frankliniella occidentalis TaxID=133901 RepID=A0A9C6X6X0_FRAOC|nr:uncharacterized protein LOC127751163 isoform X2 [Frankliniella occidentalis]
MSMGSRRSSRSFNWKTLFITAGSPLGLSGESVRWCASGGTYSVWCRHTCTVTTITSSTSTPSTPS